MCVNLFFPPTCHKEKSEYVFNPVQPKGCISYPTYLKKTLGHSIGVLNGRNFMQAPLDINRNANIEKTCYYVIQLCCQLNKNLSFCKSSSDTCRLNRQIVQNSILECYYTRYPKREMFECCFSKMRAKFSNELRLKVNVPKVARNVYKCGKIQFYRNKDEVNKSAILRYHLQLTHRDYFNIASNSVAISTRIISHRDCVSNCDNILLSSKNWRKRYNFPNNCPDEGDRKIRGHPLDIGHILRCYGDIVSQKYSINVY